MSKLLNLEDRCRLFFFIVYHESELYDYVETKRLLKSFKNWAYITHDQDLNDKGELKKVHDHWLVRLDNAMTLRSFIKKTGIPQEHIQRVVSERSCARYLTHIDEEDKYIYSFEDIKASSNYQRYIKKCYEDVETEEEIILKLFNYIEHLVSITSDYKEMLRLFIIYVNSNAYDTIFKRYRYELKEYMKDML